MKRISVLMNAAFLLLLTGHVGALEHNDYPKQPLLAPSEKVSRADQAFIEVIEKEIRNPLTPFPGEFQHHMTLTAIQRDKMNISLHLTSSETFDQVTKILGDPLAAADMISEGYFYFLPFLYDNKRGVCRHNEFYPTQAVIKIKYYFPNIGYRTQLVKPVSEICGWSNRDKTPSRDTSFNVTAQRNLFSSYTDVLSRLLTLTWGNEYANNTLSMHLDNETLLFTLDGPQAINLISEKTLTALFTPKTCEFIQQFTLLNIKVRFETHGDEKNPPHVIEKNIKQLCAPHA